MDVKPGDVVILKSGGHPVTVAEVNEEAILCLWMGNEGDLFRETLPLAVLELAEAGSVFFTRPHLADYISTPEELGARAMDLFGHYSAGNLKPAIDRVFLLDDAAGAHRYLEGRNTRGKVLLKI